MMEGKRVATAGVRPKRSYAVNGGIWSRNAALQLSRFLTITRKSRVYKKRNPPF